MLRTSISTARPKTLTIGLAFCPLRYSVDCSLYSLAIVFGGGGAEHVRSPTHSSRAFGREELTASSDGGEDTVGSEHGEGCTDDDFHGVVRGVEWGSGTVGAKGDKVG